MNTLCTLFQDWEDVQVLMGKTGKNGMLRRVRQFDTVDVQPDTKYRVEKTLNEHSETEVRLASAGAGTFYVWVTMVTFNLRGDDIFFSCKFNQENR